MMGDMRINPWFLCSRRLIMILVTLAFAFVGAGGIRSLQPSGGEEGKSPTFTRLFEEVVHLRATHTQLIQVRLDTKVQQQEKADQLHNDLECASSTALMLAPAPRAPPPPSRAPPGITA